MAPADGDEGFAAGLQGTEDDSEAAGRGKATGEVTCFGEVEVEVMVETVFLGALFWIGL